MEENKKMGYIENSDNEEIMSKKMKKEIEEVIEKLEDQAFMEGYEYAIQLLIDGKTKNRR